MESLAILIVDKNGVIVQANPAARAILGPCSGRLCASVVGVRDVSGGSPCTMSCSSELLDNPLVSQNTRGSVRGGSFKVQCSAVGSQVVVVMAGDRPIPAPPQVGLTPRETEVLGLVAEGLTGKQIGTRLGIRFPTVRTHIERVRDKLGVRTRAGAVARALELGLLNLE